MKQMKNIKQYSIRLGDEIISYTLEKKTVKYINLRIKPTGEVRVSAPRRVPIAVIERFLLEKSTFILSHLHRYHTCQANTLDIDHVIDGETFSLFGQPKTLHIIVRASTSIQQEGNQLHFTVPDDLTEEQKQKILSDYFTKQLADYIATAVDRIYPLFEPMGVSMPTIQLRLMTSRWGSCFPNKGKITLSKRLVHLPPSVIDYVILHEFAHFIHPNHAKPFYSLVASLMPDWQARRAVLNDAVFANKKEKLSCIN